MSDSSTTRHNIYEGSKNELINDIDKRARNEFEFSISGEPQYSEYKKAMTEEAIRLAEETKRAVHHAVRGG